MLFFCKDSFKVVNLTLISFQFIFKNDENFTDDCGIIVKHNLAKVYVVNGENKNFKFTKTECNVYLSLTKSFFDNRLSLQAAVHNLFNSYREYLCNYGTRTKTQLMRDDTCPKFELTLRYRFNATNSKYRGSGAGDAQKARLGNDN